MNVKGLAGANIGDLSSSHALSPRRHEGHEEKQKLKSVKQQIKATHKNSSDKTNKQQKNVVRRATRAQSFVFFVPSW